MSDERSSDQPRNDAPEPEDEAEPRPDGDASDEAGGSDEEERRPISVRDLMPEPSPERRRREPPHRAPGGDQEPREAPSEPDGESTAGDEGGAGRPTPVRVAMDAPPPGDSRPVESLPSRTFEALGREWIVRITGRTVTGTRPDAGALLMQLEFFHPREPETPVRELLTVDRPLDALYEKDLEELLERSREAGDPEEGTG